MPVETRRFDSVEAFLDVCGSFLEARESEHQLTLGILGDALARRDFPEDGALVASLAGGRAVATAIWTPPWNVILSEVDDEQAIHAIADSLAGDDLGGVSGRVEHAEGLPRPGASAPATNTSRRCASAVTPSNVSPYRGKPRAAYVGLERATGPCWRRGWMASIARRWAARRVGATRLDGRRDVPVLLVVGGADPQDPPANIAVAPLRFPNSLTIVAEGHGHTVSHLGCLPSVVDAFIAAGTVDGLDTSCVRDGVPLPPFRLP